MSPLFDDTHDDVTLPRRGDGHSAPPVRSTRELDREPADQEFTLNTGIVLALFFALALLCAAFFGFGYSIGHKSSPAVPVAASDSSAPIDATASSSTGKFKPSPGTAAVPDYLPPAGAAATPSHVASATSPIPAPRQTASNDVIVPDSSSKPAPAVHVPATTVDLPVAATAAGGTTFVQIAAVSHQEDADVLLSSLRRRGYTVLTRTDANDHLIHVQIGPFATRKDADAMRQKLLGDGYNAILK